MTEQSEDDLESVEQSAMALVNYLVEEAEALEAHHDESGFG